MKRLAGINLPFIETAPPPVRVALRVVFAALCAALGLLVVGRLEPLLSRPYFFPAFGAIILAAVFTGARYGVLTTLMFAAGFAYLDLEPRGSFAIANAHERLAVVFYAVTGCFVAGVGGALRSTYADARAQHRLLEGVYRQREELLGALTHDIRSPLSTIALTARVLARAHGATIPDLARRADVIVNNVEAVDAMLRDLVEVAALESGRITLERARVDVAAMVRQVKETLSVGLPAERLKVDPCAGELPAVDADPRRLERVFVNLLTNALKYSPGLVIVGVRPDRGGVLVSVRDEGPGIGAEDLPHIFEKYYRAKGAAAQEGLGLGLYISRLLVEAHAGRIWAESEPGKGSTFNVSLPATRGPPSPVA